MILKSHINHKGYYALKLYKNGKQKVFYAKELGLLKIGINHPMVKLTADEVRFIREVYKACDKNLGAMALGKMFVMSWGTIR